MLNSAKSDYKHCAKCRNEKHRPCEATREEEINRMYIVKGVSPFNPKRDQHSISSYSNTAMAKIKVLRKKTNNPEGKDTVGHVFLILVL